jgi:hypothetical protein
MRGRTGGFCPPTIHERLVKKRSPRRRGLLLPRAGGVPDGKALRSPMRAQWAGVLGELAVAQGATLTAYAAFECPLTGRVLGTEVPGPARAFHHEPKNPMTPLGLSLVPPVAP